MAATPPVIDLKKSFLSTQVRTLIAPLEPSSDWRENAPISEEGELKDRIVQDVLQKCTIQALLMIQAVDSISNSRLLSVVDIILRHHNRAVYSPSVLRHVAEQIYELYWESGGPDTELENEGLETLERSADLKNHNTIVQLPDEWPDDVDAEDSGLEKFAESRRYKQFQGRLLASSHQRQAQKRRLAQYKLIQELFEPFKNAQETVQPNLVTRGGELEKELEKLKILMVRAGEKIEGLSRNEEGG